jgi:pyridoxamine 5'-phosphate oxidase
METADDPIALFGRWLADVRDAGLPEPTAMVVATADADGAPSARHVLLKAYDEAGFVFCTNLGSRKARELAANPRAALVFPWFPLRRQVVVAGAVERISDDEAAAHFAARPRGAQLAAWASRQSEVIPSRQWLDERWAAADARFRDAVPLPEFWGGYRVKPLTIEFWRGADNRLHDRERYRREGEHWVVERLAP